MKKSKKKNTENKKPKPRKVKVYTPKSIISDHPSLASLTYIQKAKKFFTSTAGVIITILTLTGIVISSLADWPGASRYFKSERENENNEKYKTGEIILPSVEKDFDTISEAQYTIVNSPLPDTTYNEGLPKIHGLLVRDYDNRKLLRIFFGDTIIETHPRALYNGFNVVGKRFKDCMSQSIVLGVKDNRIYVSTEFKDLKNEEFVGNIKFNKWKLYKQNFLDYNDDDKVFAVYDKQNYTIFDIACDDTERNIITLVIRGYFLGPRSILTTNSDGTGTVYNRCISKGKSSWKMEAETEIAKIRKEFWMPLGDEARPNGFRRNMRSYAPEFIMPYLK